MKNHLADQSKNKIQEISSNDTKKNQIINDDLNTKGSFSAAFTLYSDISPLLTGCCTIVSGGYGLDKWKDFANRWHTDYDFKTFVNSFGSALITLAFAIFNFVLGIKSSSPWHISIAIYYVFLTGIRVFLIHSGTRHADSRNILILAAASLVLIDTSLGAPLTFLVKNQKPISSAMTQIPSVSVAAYTTFKITMASINQTRKRKRSTNRFVRILRTINFIDALLSLMVLQNTLILLNSVDRGASLKPLIITTSTAIWIVIVILSFMTLRNVLKDKSGSSFPGIDIEHN